MLTNETVLTLSEAATRLPKVNGRPVHTSCVWRWIRCGIGGIKLEAIRLGGRWLVSLEGLERFGAAVAEASVAADPPAHPPRPRTSRQRERDIRRARENLEAAGI